MLCSAEPKSNAEKEVAADATQQCSNIRPLLNDLTAGVDVESIQGLLADFTDAGNLKCSTLPIVSALTPQTELAARELDGPESSWLLQGVTKADILHNGWSQLDTTSRVTPPPPPDMSCTGYVCACYGQISTENHTFTTATMAHHTVDTWRRQAATILAHCIHLTYWQVVHKGHDCISACLHFGLPIGFVHVTGNLGQHHIGCHTN
eukprot:GHUV01048656.1.p1 GENE.GHUV01048656.1~~GHUV01048656.1.p1  ORF type:complete len:206 (-),score=31.91 GHUV01048656.1:132-749(-)